LKRLLLSFFLIGTSLNTMANQYELSSEFANPRISCERSSYEGYLFYPVGLVLAPKVDGERLRFDYIITDGACKEHTFNFITNGIQQYREFKITTNAGGLGHRSSATRKLVHVFENNESTELYTQTRSDGRVWLMSRDAKNTVCFEGSSHTLFFGTKDCQQDTAGNTRAGAAVSAHRYSYTLSIPHLEKLLKKKSRAVIRHRIVTARFVPAQNITPFGAGQAQMADEIIDLSIEIVKNAVGQFEIKSH
jgi:hypothetical protein